MGLHVIIGEDDFLVAETARKIVGDGVGLEVIDSLNSTNEDLRLRDIREADASFSTPPFLDPRKVTWWKNVGFLPCGGGRKKDGGDDDEKGSSSAVRDALEKFARKLAASPLPDNQEFILSGPRLLAASGFAKTLKAAGEMVVFSSGKPWEVRREATVRVMDWAQEMGLTMTSGVAANFVDRVGTDSRSIRSELGKLRDYLGGDSATVTAADLAEVTSQGVGVEPAVWDITDAIGARDLEKALAATRRFELENGFAVIVTTVVEKFFRQMIAFKDAQAKGRLDEAAEGMSPYAARKMAGFCANWTLAELRRARFRFLNLRERAISTSGSADVQVLTEIIRATRRSVN